MSSIIRNKVNALIHKLRKCVKTSLLRRRGYLLGSSAVQHLNPACRAARSVPQLSVARLLISLNDYDIVIPKESAESAFGYIYQTLFWLLVTLIIVLSMLPDLAQEVCIKSLVTIIVNLTYLSIFAGGDDIYIAFGIGTATFIGIFLVAGLLTHMGWFMSKL